MTEEQVGAQAFAEKMQGFLKFSNTLLPRTSVATPIPSYSEPGKMRLVGETMPSWRQALNKSWEAVNPFTSPGPDMFADSVHQISKSSGEAVSAAAATVKAAGGGILSGFRWATIAVTFAIVFYLFLLLRPFIPSVGRTS